MKVRELLEFLQIQDPDAEVCLVTAPNWPMEHALGSVAVRGELLEEVADGAAVDRDGAAPNDVVLIEGRWLRYGFRSAWAARTTRRAMGA